MAQFAWVIAVAREGALANDARGSERVLALAPLQGI